MQVRARLIGPHLSRVIVRQTKWSVPHRGAQEFAALRREEKTTMTCSSVSTQVLESLHELPAMCRYAWGLLRLGELEPRVSLH